MSCFDIKTLSITASSIRINDLNPRNSLESLTITGETLLASDLGTTSLIHLMTNFSSLQSITYDPAPSTETFDTLLQLLNNCTANLKYVKLILTHLRVYLSDLIKLGLAK
jgi:hypothetical protein